MSASGATSYTWTPNTSINTSTGSSVTATPTSSITYTVTGSGTNGCTSSKSITVTVNANPLLTGSANTTICSGTTTTLTSGGATSYTWSPATGLNATTGVTVNATPTMSTTYTVTGTTSAGCTGNRTVAITVTSGCGIPTGLSAQNITGSSALISWSAQPCAVSYRLQYKKSGTTTWTTINPIPSASYSITGLSANTTYEYRIRTNCSSTNSSYTSILTFTTSSTIRMTEEVNEIIRAGFIYPNPTSGIFSVNLTMEENNTIELSLYSVYGQLIWSDTQTIQGDRKLDYDIGTLAQGIYLLLVSNKHEKISYKIIKE
jgi:hypothetical protein